MSYGILIVEDEDTLARNIQVYLECYGYEVRICKSGEESLQRLETFKPEAIFLDIHLPDANGGKLLSRIRKVNPEVKIIVMTVSGNVQTAVEAMKAGAYDFLCKPLILSELQLLLDKALEHSRLEGDLSYYREKEASGSNLSDIVGESVPMQVVKGKIRRLLQVEKENP